MKYKFLLLLVPVVGFFLYRFVVSQPAATTAKVQETEVPAQPKSKLIVSDYQTSDLEGNMTNIMNSLEEGPSSETNAIALNTENFENLIQDCLEGKPCDFSEDPWIMYSNFKLANNKKANQMLIDYLGAQKLTDLNTRDKYKFVVKKMIEDFFTKEERPIPDAEYAMYMGENEKALKMFKAINNPNFDLNLANIHYDLKQYDKSLEYYQKEREKLIVNESDPNKNPALDYVETQIDNINKQLSK